MSPGAAAGPPSVLGATTTGDPLEHVPQPSRLRACLHTWRAAGASRSQLADLALGVRWRWAAGKPPPKLRVPNPQLSSEQQQALRAEVARLLALGAVRRVHAPPHCCLPVFLVQKASGSWRLIHDLRRVNSFLAVPRFRLEGLSAAPDLAQPGDLSATVDLKDAYLHIPVHRRFQRYLGFAVDGQFFVWTALPFGLALSPRVFTKALRPVLAALRAQQLRVTSYFDDFLLLAAPQEAPAHLARLLATLASFGLRVNPDKVTPLSHATTYLGVVIDTNDTSTGPIFRPSAETRNNLRKLVQSARASRAVSARRLAGLLGLANFFARSVPRTTLFCRRLQQLLATKRSWNDKLPLTAPHFDDLTQIATLIRNPVPRRLRPPPPGFRLETDASGWGWGATLSDAGPPMQGPWASSGTRSAASSNQRELSAVAQAADAFGDRLPPSSVVRVVTDNSVTATYLRRLGGRVPELSERARSLLLRLWEKDVEVQAEFRPGSQNAIADFLSRPDPYGLRAAAHVFRRERAFLGPTAIDAFATPANALLPTFWSRVALPGAAAADALAQDWTGTSLWLFPPFPVIPQVLRKLYEQPPLQAAVLVPHWPAQPWFRPLMQWARQARVLPPSPQPVLLDPIQPAPRGFSASWTWVLCRRW